MADGNRDPRRLRLPAGRLVRAAVPALIWSIEATHDRPDAEFGVYYLVSA